MYSFSKVFSIYEKRGCQFSSLYWMGRDYKLRTGRVWELKNYSVYFLLNFLNMVWPGNFYRAKFRISSAVLILMWLNSSLSVFFSKVRTRSILDEENGTFFWVGFFIQTLQGTFNGLWGVAWLCFVYYLNWTRSLPFECNFKHWKWRLSWREVRGNCRTYHVGFRWLRWWTFFFP